MKNFLCKCVFVLALWLIKHPSEASSLDSLYSAYFPSGIKLGITGDKIQKIRPNAVKNIFSKSTLDNYVLLERSGLRIIYQYYVKEGKLRAVSRGIIKRGMTQAEFDLENKIKEQIYNELSKNFDKKETQPILRTIEDSNLVLTVELWQDKTTEKQVYFLSTSQDATLIIFEPAFFEKTDFFVDPIKKPLLDKNNEIIANMISNFTIQKQQQASQTPKQRPSSVLSNFVPNPFSKTNQIPKKRSVSNSSDTQKTSFLQNKNWFVIGLVILGVIGLIGYWNIKKKH